MIPIPIPLAVAFPPSLLPPPARRLSVGGAGGRGRVSARVTSSDYARAADIRAEARAMARAAHVPVYDPDVLAREYRSRPLKVLRRALKLMIGLCALGIQLWLDQLFGVIDQNRRTRAQELRAMLMQFGPTFVKIGQALSTRPDLCPPEYIEELSQLQDALPSVPDAEAFDRIEKELDQPLDSVFSTISPSPVAAASLGQVYKARLKSCGKLVAVKVQRPGIEEVIGLDFFLMRRVGLLVDKYFDRFVIDMVPLIDEFALRVYQELNYVQVSAGGTQCQEV
ncbi:hypothetical protein MLD38_000861 [Melastoma candidum]|uniref:Uncharacterized protein n=1 Tax=Melastoma candidum TaxID=119954 RepID=A0ACB9SDE6_9MYRT|nr:hypothetical protein MLD38_000861 [Melastoma candidum]